MTLIIHTYKQKRTFKNVEIIQFEKAKLSIYVKGKAFPVKSYYQYDIKFYCLTKEE